MPMLCADCSNLREWLAVGCVTSASDACLMLHASAKSHVIDSPVPVTGGRGGLAACRFLEDARLGAGQWTARRRAHPRSRLDTVGQQCGLPAARATTQEVLGAGMVDRLQCAGGADWLMSLARGLL